MTTAWLGVYQSLLVIAILLGVGVLYFARDQRDKPGFRPFLVLVAGGLIYVTAKLVVSVVRGTPPVFVVTRFNPLGAGLAAVGFCLFAIEYTGIEQPVSRRTAALLFVVPALVNTAVWLDIEYLWIPTGQGASTVSGYSWDFTGLALANQVYLNLVVIAGILLLIRFGVRSAGPFALQVSVLVLAGVAPVLGNLLFQVGYVPFNLAPIMIVFSGCVIVWIMIRGHFLDLVPISRDVVIDSVKTGAITVDTAHRVIDINRAARQQLGLAEDDAVIGQHIDEAFRNNPPWREAYWSSTDGETGETLEVEIADRHYEIEPTHLTWADGRLRGRSFLIRNITDRIEREQELERKNERLDQFASMVSHDLINPLHTAQGYLDLARETNSEDDFENVSNAHDRMETMIDELLTLSRLDSGIDDTEIEAISLESAVTEAWQTVTMDGATLETEIADGWVMTASPVILRHILENLLQNAADHNEPPLTVTVGTIDGEGFYVADNGVGIAQANRQEIFEKGYTSADRGTGFGLSIVQELASTHGWTITVTESEEGGARFEITGITVDQ